MNERLFEDCGDGPMFKYYKMLEEFVNVTSTNRDFSTMQHAFAFYEQMNRGLSNYPERKNQQHGIHTHPLNI